MVKKIFIIINFLLVCTCSVCGQTHESNTDDIFTFMFLSEAPHYKVINASDVDSLKSFVEENLQYPESALQDKIEGTVWIRFWIDTSGYTADHEVLRGIREDLDEEALRIAKLLIYSYPATQKDKPIRVSYVAPIKFELPETKALKEQDILKKKKKNKVKKK